VPLLHPHLNPPPIASPAFAGPALMKMGGAGLFYFLAIKKDKYNIVNIVQILELSIYAS
jgi:hypothetical protein